MPVETIMLNGQWQLNCLNSTKLDKDTALSVLVPGDVHCSLLEASLIPDPFWADNFKYCDWVSQADWLISRNFEVDPSCKGKTLKLAFDGIDTYSVVKLNGHPLGKTQNMFRQYVFDISDIVNFGSPNRLEVEIRSTRKTIAEKDVTDYFGCFNVHRIFSRRAQCQFSWDWAPDLLSVGIWQNVKLQVFDGSFIENVYARGDSNGVASFDIKVDQSINNIKAGNSNVELEIALGNSKHSFNKKVELDGTKNFVDIKINDPDLWWPNGYGNAELYDYKITLKDGLNLIDEYCGSLGFRTVELIQEPDGKGQRSFRFKVNGTDIFCMGANWVPCDCFTGTIEDKKYQRLLQLAKDANLNTIRVWGGGIYENDVFYDLCDRMGLLVWQDMMFACGDIPDDDNEFVAEVVEEFKYQVKRLRNHTCIFHWCGGNEKTGAFGALIKRGDLITRYIARGIINDLTPEASYTPSSPFSYNDVANESSSGDTHGGTYEEAFTNDISEFRAYIDKKKAVFMSEFGLHGPPVLKSLRQFFPAEDIWPLGDIWECHVQDNPYNSIPETFVQIQRASASRLFYEPQNIQDFVKTAGTFYSEYLYAEFQHHRRRLPENNGAMMWMLNDCWPAANWSVIDYYGRPKQAYFALKRACRPVMLSVRQTVDKYEIYLTNNSDSVQRGEINLYIENIHGSRTFMLAKTDVCVSENDSAVCLSIDRADRELLLEDSYIRVVFDGENAYDQEIYFHNLWKDIGWSDPEIDFKILNVNMVDGYYCVNCRIFVSKFARCVNIIVDEDIDIYISDNYFDIPAGCYKDITIRASKKIDTDKLRVDHWLTDWDDQGEPLSEKKLELISKVY